MLLLAGAAGSGLVLLATRQHLARVIEVAPRPLPATVTILSGQDLLPAVAALAVAALASLAAVLATRRLLRRITGLITAALGVGIMALAAGHVSVAEVLAAAGAAGASPATGSGAGTAPGSVTAGSGTGQVGGSLAGFPAHVVFEGSLWRGLMIGGALLLIAAGLVILVRANRLPAMSGRYERSAGVAGMATDRGSAAAAAGSAGGAKMWESLSAGADPTASPGGGEGG